VSQSKFTVLKITPRKNFGQFMKFLSEGLNTFKIQSDFELEFLLNFIIQNPGQIGSWAKKDVCLFVLNLSINLPNLEIFGVK
jgi:hypothetical protein